MEGHFSSVDEEEEQQRTTNVAVPIWRAIASMIASIVIFISIAIVICVLRDVSPTLHNMLNDKSVSVYTGPFVVTAVNLLQAAHFIMAMALYYRTLAKAGMLATTQVVLAVATHASLLLVLFLLPFVGWSRDWAVMIPVYTWGAWEAVALLSLRLLYRHQLHRERRHLLLSLISFAVYVVATVSFTVLALLPAPRSVLVELSTSAVQGAMTVAVLGFLALLVLHTKRVYFTMYVAAL